MEKRRKATRRQVSDGNTLVVDPDGVILSDTPKFKTINLKERTKYASMYLDDENLFTALKGLGNFGAIWGYVLTEYNKDKALFYFSASVREDICDRTDLSDGTVRSAISSFCESGMLLKVRNAEYMVNPRFFYVGSWDKRPAMIELYDSKKEVIEIAARKKAIDSKTVNVEDHEKR